MIPKSSFITTLAARGFIHRCTDMPALDAHCCVGPVKAMSSFDLDADGFHAGHLLQLMALRWLQRSGHKPIVLIGWAGTTISDPPPHKPGVPLQTGPEHEIAAARRSLSRFITIGDGPTDALLLHRHNWDESSRLHSALEDRAAHIPINRMVAEDRMRARLERGHPMTLREFSDMALRIFDFLALARRENCLLQLGALEQWGGILDGIELAHRIDRRQLFGLTTPLPATGAGIRIGGAQADTIQLDPAGLSPSAFRQSWRNSSDADVPRFLRLFTELPLDAIARLTGPDGPGIDEAKTVLADEVTRLVHGGETALEHATAPAADTPVRQPVQAAA